MNSFIAKHVRHFAPLIAALFLSGCVCTMKPQAAALRPTAAALLESSKTDAYSEHDKEVQALRAKFQADLDAKKGKTRCAPRVAEYSIWSGRIMTTFDRWKAKEPNPLNPVFVDEQVQVIDSQFAKVK